MQRKIFERIAVIVFFLCFWILLDFVVCFCWILLCVFVGNCLFLWEIVCFCVNLFVFVGNCVFLCNCGIRWNLSFFVCYRVLSHFVGFLASALNF